jgi:formylglycine-generating enzyme required for sulfatase activity
MGSDFAAFTDSKPIHQVDLDGFWIDETLVTNQEYEEFVNATRYITVAEQKPDPAEFPGVAPEKLVPGSLVFTPPKHPVPINDVSKWWSYVPGACWRHPEGPGSSIKGREIHPVVQVCYTDASAYAKWCGKRLPTEAEFAHR